MLASDWPCATTSLARLPKSCTSSSVSHRVLVPVLRSAPASCLSWDLLLGLFGLLGLLLGLLLVAPALRCQSTTRLRRRLSCKLLPPVPPSAFQNMHDSHPALLICSVAIRPRWVRTGLARTMLFSTCPRRLHREYLSTRCRAALRELSCPLPSQPVLSFFGPIGTRP